MICKNIKTYPITSFDGGINKNLLKTEIKNNELSDSLNMWYKGGKIVTRDGINLKRTFALSNSLSGANIRYLGNSTYSNEGLTKFYQLTKEANETIQTAVYVVNSDGSSIAVLQEVINKSSFENEIADVVCSIIKGKAIKGSGIFIVQAVIDVEDNIVKKQYYELYKNRTNSYVIYPSDIYAPLVMVNGRGNNFSSLSSSEKTNYPKPSLLEDFNLLSNGFRSCFKTDGVSSKFYLPVKELSSNFRENITAKFTAVNGSVYTWQIPYSANESVYVTVDSTQVKIAVNRTSGCVSFKDNSSNDYALPKVEGLYNNLEITAYKPYGNNDIFTGTVFESFNSRAFVSGCRFGVNTVYFSKRNNPLYFPSSNVAYFGDKSAAVTALVAQNDRLIAFKAHKIGICSTINYSEYNTELIILGKANKRGTLERMDIKTVNTGIGCTYPETLINCANRLVFLGSDMKVYTITSSANYLQRLYKISENIDGLLFDVQINHNAFAADYKGHYMLFLDNKCYLFNYNTDAFLSASSPNGSVKKRHSIGWYCFEYNIGNAALFSSIALEDNIIILGRSTDNNANGNIFHFTISGDKDTYFVSEQQNIQLSFLSRFATKAYDMDTYKYKKILGLRIVFGKEAFSSSKNITLKYCSQNCYSNAKTIATIAAVGEEFETKRIPIIFVSEYFGFMVECNSKISVKEAFVEYQTK